MLEFEILAFPQAAMPMSGLVATDEKALPIAKLVCDSHPDSKMLENMLETA